MASTTFYYFCYYYFSFFIVSSSSLVMACDPCFYKSTAALFSNASSSTFTSGACGYGALATHLSDDYLPEAAIDSLYRDGGGCGSCYQVRCKNQTLCNQRGTKVIVTDLNNNNHTDFLLTRKAFISGMARHILEVATLDFEYKRLPCKYEKKNFSVRIQESSLKPNYLAMHLVYQGGQTDIVAIDVAKAGDVYWHYMSRKYGAIWETNRIPAGGMQFHFFVTGDYDGKYVWAKNVIPADWKIGEIYDSGLQITQIAPEGCPGCDASVHN